MPAKTKIPLPKEAEIQKQILMYLSVRGVFHWRQNSGALVLPATNKRGRGFYRFCSMPGVSDILGVLPDGRFLAIEVKRPGQKPTTSQAAFIDAVNRLGGLAFVAHSVGDVEKGLGES